jgi:hypothetical protein
LPAILIAALYAPQSAWAWGPEGHQIIARIAALELTSTARAQVQELLGGDPETAMVEVSTWADEIRRGRPNTAPWHFVDIPVGSAGYDHGRDCRNDNCVVAQIEREKAILLDRQLAAPVRTEALRFLIHFVGDIHQPLHAADNGDRGGNEVRVVLGRRQTNLHAVWDTPLVQSLGRDANSVADNLVARITPDDRRKWQAGNAVDWANDTFRVANAETYAKLPGSGGTDAPVILPPNYAASERATVSAQLEKASVRLASVLNETLR